MRNLRAWIIQSRSRHLWKCCRQWRRMVRLPDGISCDPVLESCHAVIVPRCSAHFLWTLILGYWRWRICLENEGVEIVSVRLKSLGSLTLYTRNPGIPLPGLLLTFCFLSPNEALQIHVNYSSSLSAGTIFPCTMTNTLQRIFAFWIDSKCVTKQTTIRIGNKDQLVYTNTITAYSRTP